MRLLKVQGIGHAQAEPDTVHVSLEIVGKAKLYADAVNRLNTATERLRNAIKCA